MIVYVVSIQSILSVFDSLNMLDHDRAKTLDVSGSRPQIKFAGIPEGG